MLSDKFVSTLKELLPISKSAILQSGFTFITSKSRNIIARIDMDKLENPQFESFGVMDLGKFTSLISTFKKDGDISYSLNDGILHLKTQNYDFDYYVYNEDCLKDYQLNPAFIDQLLSVPKMMTFELSSSIIKNITDVANTFELQHIIFKKHEDDNFVSVDVTEIKRNSSEANSTRHILSIKVPGMVLDKDEQFVLDIEKLNKLPNGNYIGVVYFVKGKVASLNLISRDLPYIDFFLAQTAL